MGIDRLERVMWRLRKEYPDTNQIRNTDLRRAIDIECGTDIRTYKSNRKALIRIGWLKHKNKGKVYITNKDIGAEE